jgi:hypothetical protein
VFFLSDVLRRKAVDKCPEKIHLFAEILR